MPDKRGQFYIRLETFDHSTRNEIDDSRRNRLGENERFIAPSISGSARIAQISSRRATAAALSENRYGNTRAVSVHQARVVVLARRARRHTDRVKSTFTGRASLPSLLLPRYVELKLLPSS